MGNDFRALKEHSKEKKRANLEHSTAQLVEFAAASDGKVSLESKNNGVHLIVKHASAEYIDYWPSTGKWISRKRGEGRGIQSLLQKLRAMR
jgi:hypothetical protein